MSFLLFFSLFFFSDSCPAIILRLSHSSLHISVHSSCTLIVNILCKIEFSCSKPAAVESKRCDQGGAKRG
jgi:hypothetical protein